MQEDADFADHLVSKVPPASLLAFDLIAHVSSSAVEDMHEIQEQTTEQTTMDVDPIISALEDELEFSGEPFDLKSTEYSRNRQVSLAPQNTCDAKDEIDLFMTEEEAAALVATKTPKRNKKIVKQNKTKAKTDADRKKAKEKSVKKKNKRLCDTTHFQKLNDCNIHKKMFMGANSGVYSGKSLKTATSADWKKIKEKDPVTRAYYKQIANDFNTFALHAYNQDKYDESTMYMLNSKWRESIKNVFWATYN
jgi:hypothetical protein